MMYHVRVGSRSFEVVVGSEGVSVDGKPVDVDLGRIPGTPVRSLRVNAASHQLVASSSGRGSWVLHLRGAGFEAEVIDERTRAIRELTGAAAAASGPKPITAPMPGLVVKVEVAEGEPVRPGQGVVVVEAMKMENELKAEAEGIVSRVHVAPGDTVDKGQILVDFEPPAETEQGEA